MSSIIKLQDIINAIAKELKMLFPNTEIYDEGLIQGYNEPCFFINCYNDSTKKLIGNRYDNLPKFRVVYFQDFKEERAKFKVYNVRDTLNDGFDYIDYNNMKFKVKNKLIEIQDKDLIFTFEVQYFSKKLLSAEPTIDTIEQITEKEKQDA